MSLISKYNKALQDLYDHVGFKEDWVVCPIDDCTDSYWFTDGDTVRYAKTIKDLKDEDAGEYYSDDIYTQRFYSKWIYEGKDYTMIFCDPHVDGMKWFRVFSNDKKFDTQLDRDTKIDEILD